MEMTVERGVGYRMADKNKKPRDPIGVIPVDSIFSPVRKVSYAVENTRVEQMTDRDRLVLDVETDGSITPREAVASAGGTLLDVTTDIADSVIMPEVIVPAGQTSVTVSIEGGRPGTGSLFLKGFVAGEVNVPVAVTGR